MDIKFPIKEGELFLKQIQIDNKKPTIIFLHDALGCIGTWKEFPLQLAKENNCNLLVYDRLGHGQSSKNTNKRKLDYLDKEANTLLDLITALEIKNPILFGHSDGGSIALIAASKSKNNILGVITEAAHVLVENVTLQGIMIAKMNYQKDNFHERLFKYHGLKTDKLFQDWADTWLSEDFRDWNIQHLLKNITCPCLIIQGTKDEYGSNKQVEVIQQTMTIKPEIKLLKNVAHAPHKEDSEEVLAISSKFIKNLYRNEH